MPISPTFWMPRGTSFGLWNANQKKSSTSTVLSRSSRPGLPKATLPILKSGVK